MELVNNICNESSDRVTPPPGGRNTALGDDWFLFLYNFYKYLLGCSSSPGYNNDWDWVCFHVNTFSEFSVDECCDLDTRTLLSITKHLYPALGSPAIVKWTEAINSQPEQLTTELSPRLSAWNQVKRFLDSKKNQPSPVNKIFQIFPTTLFIL